jgi:single-stranded-DNA-specific exonuclease
MELNQQARWKVLPPAPDEYSNASDVTPLIAQLLYNRNVPLDEIEPFLAADSTLQGDPFSLPDMSLAVSRIYKALLSGEKIAVYGDFDVDGVTASAILVEGLSWLGGKVTPYIPDRVYEGHGLSSTAMEKLHDQGTGLVITVDCGTGNLTEARQAQEMGMDMIITDHHIPSTDLPQAIAVVNPRRGDSRYCSTQLAGVGVAFKLLQALFHQDSREERLNSLLDLVALGTITDMVPLSGENRYLVRKGLKVLNDTHRIGLHEMIKVAGLKLGELDTEHVSWVLGPRLNSAGRVGNAVTSYRLVTTSSAEEAHALATELEEKNAERQRLTNEVLGKARQKLAYEPCTPACPPLLIQGDESYPDGVIGLVAGKLVEEFYRPAIILSLGPEVCRGSGRSIPEFNILSALEQCSDLLRSFGGHPFAAGFTVAGQNLPKLKERIVGLAVTELSHLDLHPELVIDAELPLSAFAGSTFNLMQKLSPFGQANPKPAFLTRRVAVTECQRFGNQGEHLQLKLKQGDVSWRAMHFDSRKDKEEIPPYIDIVYNLEKDWWNGEEVLRLNLLDFAPSS